MTATLADPYRDYNVEYAAHDPSRTQDSQPQLVYHAHPQASQTFHHGARPEFTFGAPGVHSQTFQHHQSTGHRLEQGQQQQQHMSTTIQQPQLLPHHLVQQQQHQPPPPAPPPAVQPQHQGQQQQHQQQQQQPPTQSQQQQHHQQFATPPLTAQYPPPRRGTKRPRTESDVSGDEHSIGLHLPMLPTGTRHDPTERSSFSLLAQGESSRHAQHPYQQYSSPSMHHHHLHHSQQTPQQQQQQQQHHHHRLPAQATPTGSLRPGSDMSSMNPSLGAPSVVGQEGMPDPAPRPKGPKLKFTNDEDTLLVDLKENKNLTWKQIAEFFPGRTSGTLQVRYCTKLKAKTTVWTDDSVLRLRNAMVEYETDRWRLIAAKVGGGFTPAACRDKAEELEAEQIQQQEQ